MADASKIEWTDATWNPITGCSVVSPGCTNCYAMRLAGTRMRHHWSREGLTVPSKAGPVWNGQVRLNAPWLDQPLRWRRPRRVFVCAHGDIFHEAVPDEWIDRVFAVMALAQQHQFQVLTKRAERMRVYLCGHAAGGRYVWKAAQAVPMPRGQNKPNPGWPLPNVWLGVSCEDQERADNRIPALLDTPAAVRFVSAEPLLGPIRFSRVPGFNRIGLDLSRWWIIVGGESGPGARPFDLAWARSIRDQCAAAGVPCFIKQLGSRPILGARNEHELDTAWPIRDGKGGDWTEWPEDLRIREWPA